MGCIVKKRTLTVVAGLHKKNFFGLPLNLGTSSVLFFWGYLVQL